MKKLFKEDIENLQFNGLIVGVPNYVEIDQHKDILFMLKDISIYYNNEKNPNSLLLVKDDFKFNSYDYFMFDNMTEFCIWYLDKQNSEKQEKKIQVDFEKSESELKTNKITRGERLKEVRDYVKQVLNIEYYKNYAVFNNKTDNETAINLSQFMADKLKQQLVDWLEEV